MSGRTLTNVVNDQTVAFNALIYGYAGHSLVTPHAVLQQVWWTEERINEKVTPEFIRSRLLPSQRESLNRPVGFGDLTDDSYMEWILEKARRLFLVLAEIGESGKIFAAVQRSWDDDDLPLAMEDIEQLALSNRRDDQADARFYNTQFTFLLRELRKGVHIDYASNEVLPLEHIMGLPPAATLQHWSRVHLPKKPNEVYVRRKFPLGNVESPMAFEMDYIMDVESARMVEHDHITPVWASYTAKGTAYVLTNFVGQHTLRTFIDHRNPTQYQRLSKLDRRCLILNWLHCLADAVATLHQSGFCHSAIRPSNILIDEQNNIAFSDIGSLETFQRDKKPDTMDAYIYSAPESVDSERMQSDQIPASIAKTPREAPVASKNSVGSFNSSGSHRQKLTKTSTKELSGFNFGFKRTRPTPKPCPRVHETEKADVFSLGCVFLEMMTFMVKKKPHEFVKHRSSKQKISTGGLNSRTNPSFHANLDKVDSWVQIIEDASLGHKDDALGAVPHVLDLIRRMLRRTPGVRPNSRDVRDCLLNILFNYTDIPEIHCGEHRHDSRAATSSRVGSDRSSSMPSLRSSAMSISTVSSDADTIRGSMFSNSQVSSILDSYADRSTLSGISESEDDDASIGRRRVPLGFGSAWETPRNAPAPPTPPISPLSAQSPRPPSSSSTTAAYKIQPWNKPFLLFP
ncbi:kinase-like domain-containing protein [Massariosphaeria phaeospora]|uniref:Kinase-like domain-containing protein n=1 Tax=Massariosphaeria phaeospora TaxID=100035 RepID=A0A7C8MCZ0_9PLEO|nr:kinase-like domain-containing protein [Massariosphaeria phaeospora]